MGSIRRKTKSGIIIIFALVVLPVVTSCRPLDLFYVEPSGPPEYQLGWQDGCDTALSASGGFMYKMFYGFKKRPEMASNTMYGQGWNEGFTYCRFSYGAIKSKPGPWY